MCLGAGLKRSQELTIELMVKKNFYSRRNVEGRKECGRKEGKQGGMVSNFKGIFLFKM